MRQNPHIIMAAALGEAMSGRSPGNALAEAEIAGQADMVVSAELPSNMGGDRSIFEAMGIQFGPPGDDPLFLPATLPPGWRKVATGHAMHSQLLDADGRVRARIFHKAAFYDRRANMVPARRYSIGHTGDDRVTRQWAALDGGETVLWATERVPKPADSAPRDEWVAFYDRSDVLMREAVSWLDENRPDWRSPLAYWDVQ